MIPTFKFKKNKIFSKLIDKALDILIRLEDLKSSYKSDDLLQKKEDEDTDLDLSPVRDFMEDYVGHLIVDVSGPDDYSDLSRKVCATIITKVFSDGNSLKFKLSKLNGSDGGVLVLAPTEFGMFTEKLSEKKFDLHTIYRVHFYGGYALEYSDPNMSGRIFHQD